ncbi:MAG: glycosyltransferase family 2 protein [Clostridia bacterium]|nr:glycosyltransferase family 2 protein [Clostridia bacterium]
MRSEISIVVPIYNSKNTIERCVKSIMNQTFNDISIILVDDGSTDESYELCKRMSKEDKRINLIHQENKGVSAARNNGIRQANSNYIMFVDSDDYIDLNICKVLHEFVKKNDCDIGIVNKVFKKDNKIIKNVLYNEDSIIRQGSEKDLFSLDLFSDFFDDKMNKVQYLSCGVTAKLFKLDMIQNNKINFFEDCNYGEDVLFNLYAYEKAKKIGYYNYDGYNFIISPNSTTHKYKKNWMEYHKKFIERIDEFNKTYKKDNRFIESANMMKATRISGLASSYFFHYDNKIKFKEKYKSYCKFINESTYKSAIKNVNFRMLTNNQKIIIFLERVHCSIIVAIISTIKNRKEKRLKCKKKL